MNLISQIFLIILIACFTGTVSLGFWRVFQPLLLKRDPRLDRQADLAWISADGKHMET